MLRLLLYGMGGLLLFALWLYCLFDAITTDESETRNLPKPLWIIVVLLLPTIGSILWLILGRPQAVARQAGPPAGFPEYDRPGRFAATSPDDDEEFLRRCRERAEEQRRRAREASPDDDDNP